MYNSKFTETQEEREALTILSNWVKKKINGQFYQTREVKLMHRYRAIEYRGHGEHGYEMV